MYTEWHKMFRKKPLIMHQVCDNFNFYRFWKFYCSSRL